MIFALLLFSMVVNASAEEVVQSLKIGDFQKITLSGNINVELIPANENAIEAKIYESLADKFRWNVNDSGTLEVSMKPTVGSNSRADVRIYYKGALHEVRTNQANVMSTHAIQANCLRVEVVGGGNAGLKIDAKDLEVDVRGNSAASFSGSAKYLTMKIIERSRVDAREMEAVSVEVSAATASEVFLKTSERIVGQTRSGATIYYAGNPTIIKNQSVNAGFGSGMFSISEPVMR